MRRALWLLLLFSLALAQELDLPESGEVGKPVPLRIEGLPPGLYALEVITPKGRERVFSLETKDGVIEFEFLPDAPGSWRIRLPLGEEVLDAVFEALLPKPHLNEEGLVLWPGRVVPLPEPERWLGPVVEGGKVYVARELIVLELDALTGEALRHYPPNLVTELLPGPKVRLADGRELGLGELKTLPFEAPWEELSRLKALEEALGPYDGPRAYWSYFAAGERGKEALAAAGRDLLTRGHRVELYWRGELPFSYLIEAAREGDEDALGFLFDYVPQFPGSTDLFSASGEPRYQLGALWVRHYAPLGLSKAFFLLFAFFGLAYLFLFLKGLFHRGRPPYGERVVGVFLLVFALGFGLLHLAAKGADTFIDRATLETLAAKRALAGLPEGRAKRALLEGEPLPLAPSTLVRAGDYLKALAFDSQSGALKDALSLGGDPWSRVYAEAGERGVSGRELELLVTLARLEGLAKDPARGLVPLFGGTTQAALAALGFGVLLLWQLFSLFRGKSQGPWPGPSSSSSPALGFLPSG